MTIWERAGEAAKPLRGPVRVAMRRTAEARLRFQAAFDDSTIELDIHPYAVFEGIPQVECYPGTHTVVRIGASTVIGRRVQFCLRGGALTVGDGCEIRHSCTLHIGGVLDIHDGAKFGVGVGLHSAERVVVGADTIVGDHCLIIDSNHLRTPPGVPIHHSSSSAPVHIGSNAWIATKSTIGSGVTIGDQAVVAGNSVVTKDVAPWTLVGGVPAKVIRQVEVDPSFGPSTHERGLDEVTEA